MCNAGGIVPLQKSERLPETFCTVENHLPRSFQRQKIHGQTIHQTFKGDVEMKINLGCGSRKTENAINIDIDKSCKPDIIADINNLPLKNSIGAEIIMEHSLEHTNPDVSLKEVRRIAKPKSRIKIVVPYYNSPDAFRDPEHKSFFHETTLNYYPEFKVLKITPQKTNLGKFIPKKLLFKLAHVFGNLISGLEFELTPNIRSKNNANNSNIRIGKKPLFCHIHCPILKLKRRRKLPFI